MSFGDSSSEVPPGRLTRLLGALKKPRSRLRDVTLVIALLAYEMNCPWIVAGLAFFVVGCSLHFWSKGVLTRNWILTTSGPYGYVRNPFYLGNLLIDLGICFLSGRALLPLLYIPAFLLVYQRTIREEERFLRQTHGTAFDEYAARVPSLFSHKIHRLFGPHTFSWLIIEQEQEIPRLLRILAIPAYFLLVDAVFHSTRPEPGRMGMILAGAVAAIALNGASLWARRRNRRSRFQECWEPQAEDGE
jgi:hypothetical protein